MHLTLDALVPAACRGPWAGGALVPGEACACCNPVTLAAVTLKLLLGLVWAVVGEVLLKAMLSAVVGGVAVDKPHD